MPKSAVGAKKKPVKVPALKEAVAKDTSTAKIAQKATLGSGKRTTSSKEKHAPVTAAPASVASSVSTSALPTLPALNEGMTCMTTRRYYHFPLTGLLGQDIGPAAMDTVTTHPTPKEQDAEIIILRGEYFNFLMRTVSY